MSEDTIDYKKLAEALAEALEQRNLWIEGEEYRELVILRMRLSARVDSLAEELKAANARIAELEAERRWIPVGERLPELGQVVSVIDMNDKDSHLDNLHQVAVWVELKGVKMFGFVTNTSWVSSDVTHWMPLPTPPEVQE